MTNMSSNNKDKKVIWALIAYGVYFLIAGQEAQAVTVFVGAIICAQIQDLKESSNDRSQQGRNW